MWSRRSGSRRCEVIVGRYRVVYRLAGDEVQIAAVVHGARRFPSEEFDAP